MARFAADIDAHTRYDEETILGHWLTMMAGPWFRDIMSIDGPSQFSDAQEFRQRHIIKALSRKANP